MELVVDIIVDYVNDMAMDEKRLEARAGHKGDEPHLLREIVRAHHAMMHAFARETGRPSAQFALMRILAHAERGLGVVEIAEALDVNAAAVTRLVNAMESERLIRRRADPRDGRRHYVSLTERGLTQFSLIHDRTHRLERLLEAELGGDAMRAAATLLAKLRAFIEERDRQ